MALIEEAQLPDTHLRLLEIPYHESPCYKKCLLFKRIETEYMAATKAVKEATKWLKSILNELSVDQEDINIHCDNQSVITLSKHKCSMP